MDTLATNNTMSDRKRENKLTSNKEEKDLDNDFFNDEKVRKPKGKKIKKMRSFYDK